MPTTTNTIVLQTPTSAYKLCKVWFGMDGSYYVTSPYHPAKKAVLVKLTVNYALQQQTVALEEAVDLGSVDDDQHRLKLSHHPSGFIQFSGSGIVSGQDADGTIRGLGVMSWPLTNPVRGPAFGMALRGVEDFARADKVSDNAVVFVASDLALMSEPRVIMIEGYYIWPLWRRFVRRVDGHRMISISHPCGAVLNLRVLLPPPSCALQGLIGLELYSMPTEDEHAAVPSFTFSSSTGNLRKNAVGELIGDGLFCHFPRGESALGRDLNFRLAQVPVSREPDAPSPG